MYSILYVVLTIIYPYSCLQAITIASDMSVIR